MADLKQQQDIQDLRIQLDENRAFLVRALRAVDVATNECRDDAKNAAARIAHLEATLNAQSEMLVRLRSQPVESSANTNSVSLSQKLSQLEEKVNREISSTLQATMNTQQDIRLSLQADLKKLSKRIDKLETAENNQSKERELESNLLRGSNVEVMQKLQRVDTEFTRVFQAVMDNEGVAKRLIHAAEVRSEAQISNSDALMSLRLTEVDKSVGDVQRIIEQLRLETQQLKEDAATRSIQIPQLQSALKSQSDSTENHIAMHQKELSDFKQMLQQNQNILESHVTDFRSGHTEMKSEIDSMFKGEMLLSKRINELQAHFDEKIQDVKSTNDDKFSQVTAFVNGRLEQLELQTSDLTAGMESLCNWVEGSLQQREIDFKKEISRNFESLQKDSEGKAQETKLQASKEIALSRSICEHLCDRLIVDCQATFQNHERKFELQTNAVDTLRSEVAGIADNLRRVQDDAFLVSEKLQQTSELLYDLQIRHDGLQEFSQNIRKEGVMTKRNLDDIKAKLDETIADSRSSMLEESSKVSVDLGQMGLLQEELRFIASAKVDGKDLREVQEGLESLRNQVKDVHSAITTLKTNSSQTNRSTQDLEPFDHWNFEGRVTKVELALIEVLEKETQRGFRESTKLLEERLETTERASSQIFAGISRLSETIDVMMQKQKQFEAEVRITRPAPLEGPVQNLPSFDNALLEELKCAVDAIKKTSKGCESAIADIKSEVYMLKGTLINEIRNDMEMWKVKAKSEDAIPGKGKINLEAVKARAKSEDLGVAEIKSELEVLKSTVFANKASLEQQIIEQEKQISLSNMALDSELQQAMQSHVQILKTEIKSCLSQIDSFKKEIVDLKGPVSKNGHGAGGTGPSLSITVDDFEKLESRVSNLDWNFQDTSKQIESIRSEAIHIATENDAQFKSLASAIAETNQIQEAMAMDAESKEQSRIESVIQLCQESIASKLKSEFKLYADEIALRSNSGAEPKILSSEENEFSDKIQSMRRELTELDGRYELDMQHVKAELSGYKEDIDTKFNRLASAIAETNQIQESMSFDISNLSFSNPQSIIKEYLEKTVMESLLICQGELKEVITIIDTRCEQIFALIVKLEKNFLEMRSSSDPLHEHALMQEVKESIAQYLETVVTSEVASCNEIVQGLADALQHHRNDIKKINGEQDNLKKDASAIHDMFKQDGFVQKYVDNVVAHPLADCQLQVRDLAKALSEVISNQKESVDRLMKEQNQLAKKSEFLEQIGSLTNEIEDIRSNFADESIQKKRDNDVEQVSVQDFDNLQEDFQLLQEEVKSLSSKLSSLVSKHDLEESMRQIQEHIGEIQKQLERSSPEHTVNEDADAKPRTVPTIENHESARDESAESQQIFGAASNGSARIKALAAQVRKDIPTSILSDNDTQRSNSSWSNSDSQQDPIHLEFV